MSLSHWPGLYYSRPTVSPLPFTVLYKKRQERHFKDGALSHS